MPSSVQHVPSVRAKAPENAALSGHTLPRSAGTSFKLQHAREIAEDPGEVAWFEVHPENYMVPGGPRLHALERLRERHPVSFHGVGLSLGSGPPDPAHLAALRSLVERFQPAQVSEHVAWSAHDGLYLADLLPIAFTPNSVDAVVANIQATQDALAQTILVENPAAYLPRPEHWLGEVEFLCEVARRSGCGLLLDINNVYVSARNLGFDARAYLDALPAGLIAEIHVAGHDSDAADDGAALLIDSHRGPVAEPVWALYERVVSRIGPRPTLVEWDTDVPDWSTLRAQAAAANARSARRGLVENGQRRQCRT